MSAIAWPPLSVSVAGLHVGEAGVGVGAGQRLRAAREGQPAGAAEGAGEGAVGIGQRQRLRAQVDRPAAGQGFDRRARRRGRDVERAVVYHAGGAGDAARPGQREGRAAADGRAAGVGVGSGQRLRAAREGQPAGAAEGAGEGAVGIGQRERLRAQVDRAAAGQGFDRRARRRGGDVERAVVGHAAGAGDAARPGQGQGSPADRGQAAVGVRPAERDGAGRGLGQGRAARQVGADRARLHAVAAARQGAVLDGAAGQCHRAHRVAEAAKVEGAAVEVERRRAGQAAGGAEQQRAAVDVHRPRACGAVQGCRPRRRRQCAGA